MLQSLPRGAALLGGAFDPRSLPGLALWLDASRITGLGDGDPVATWRDLSGSGNDATQATAGKRPLYKVGIRNGKPVVRFDGVDDCQAEAISSLSGAQTVALVYALRSVPTSSAFATLLSCKNGGGTFNEVLLGGTGTGFKALTFYADLQASAQWNGVAVTLDTAWHVLVCTYAGSSPTAAASYTMTLDGMDQTVAASGPSNSARVSTDVGGVGARINSGGTPSVPAAADIGAVLAYTRALPTTDRQYLGRGLGAQWGVTVS